MCYCTWCVALVLLDVVGSGCGALRCRVRAICEFTFLQGCSKLVHRKKVEFKCLEKTGVL